MVREFIASGSMSFGMYPGLSQGAYRAILAHGSDELKRIYLPKLVDGTWTGTMCLTEPDSGSDLSRLRTRAEPEAEGSYRVTGTKIFISSGDHDLTENIVHLVLARLPDAPPGTRGLSLFVRTTSTQVRSNTRWASAHKPRPCSISTARAAG
jgi:alkylation response protein AidB-like acyl-CoA dehydrogenase